MRETFASPEVDFNQKVGKLLCAEDCEQNSGLENGIRIDLIIEIGWDWFDIKMLSPKDCDTSRAFEPLFLRQPVCIDVTLGLFSVNNWWDVVHRRLGKELGW